MDDELLDAATRRLYAAPADEFAGLRRALADEATRDGDAETGRAVGKLRKPTNPARIVNALVADDPSVVDSLRDLGDRMRDAQDSFDAARMRELTDERRRLVADCARRALALAGADDPAAALRDDVLGTFDAAVADPDVAARLGTLQRPERFSGFGFAASGPPQLTLVRGGGKAPAKKAGAKKAAAKKVSAAERRKQRRALDAAQRTFDDADAALDAAQSAERDAIHAVDRREREQAKAKRALDDARAALDERRTELKDAKRERREARSALDREQRNAD
ncbi:hypothetical protein [uncultured Jatrophihabitans sp.]|uniref:hypothetical protein n=1 Tax=uncultured Jatrophihabitans sp. TaxID=1610747 RepID=UPI0035CB44F9